MGHEEHMGLACSSLSSPTFPALGGRQQGQAVQALVVPTAPLGLFHPLLLFYVLAP